MKSPLNRGGLRFYLVAVALGIGTLLCRATTSQSILAGLPLLGLGVCLHTWAKGCLRQNRVVATIGPYRFVRHPFYLANAMIDAGLAVMAGWLPLILALPIWWLAIYIPVIRGEERYLSEKFPEEYSEYRRRVPCLVPWRHPLPYSGDGFRWSNPNIAAGEELPRVVRILAYPLLFFIAQGLRSGGFDWLKDGWNVSALTALAALYSVARQLHRHQRQRLAILPSAIQHPVFRAAAAAAVLAAVYLLHRPTTAYRNVMPIAGAALLLISAPIYARKPMRAILAEMVALTGAAAAGELAWLALLAVTFYEAWILDWQLRSTPATRTGDGTIGARSTSHADDSALRTDAKPQAFTLEPTAAPAAYWPYLYPLLAAACAVVIGIKLAGRVLPYHFGLE